MMKRWWMVALVFTLALSLTSCSRKKTQLGLDSSGKGYCEGTLGSFYIYVEAANPGFYQVIIRPVSLDAPGDIVSITVANQGLAYRELSGQAVLFQDRDIHAGTLTDTELENYEFLVITPYQPGVSFLETTPEKDAVCNLPLPGDGADQNQKQN